MGKKNSNDLLLGMDADNNSIKGFGGDDVLVGGAKADILKGGEGNDILIGLGHGSELLSLSAQGDELHGGTGYDTYYACDGDVIRDTYELTPLGSEFGKVYYTTLDNTGKISNVRELTGGTMMDWNKYPAWLRQASWSFDIYQSNDGSGYYVYNRFEKTLLYMPNTETVISPRYGITIDNFDNGDLGIYIEGFHGPIANASGIINGICYLDSGFGNKVISNLGSDHVDIESITFGAGIEESHVVCVRNNDDLILNNTLTNDSLTVLGYFQSDGDGVIAEICFDDGTAWDERYLRTLNDVYRYVPGTGQVVISNLDTTHNPYEAIQFPSGMDESLVAGFRSNDDLILQVIDTDDQITVQGFFAASGDGVIHEIRFSEGVIWDELYIRSFNYSGTVGNDTLIGYDTEDTIEGLSGNDNITGNGGYDYLVGNEGNDTLSGGNDDDTLEGGYGKDILKGDSGLDELYGDDDNDTLHGGTDDDYLYGGSGDDHLNGDDGDDWLEGGTEKDYLAGGAGNDVYYFDSGFGQDVINNYDTDIDRIDAIEFGEEITDSDVKVIRKNDDLVIKVVGTDDQITVMGYFVENGGGHVDEIRFADGVIWNVALVKILILTATAGDDVLTGNDTDDAIDGESGNDTLYGGSGNDHLTGGEGDDLLSGDNGHDTLEGGIGNDNLNGNSGNDLLYGNSGDDHLIGGEGDDLLSGDNDHDTLEGAAGNDILNGNSGNDLLYGNSGDDQLIGGTGDDRLEGGTGYDRLEGGVGNDSLFGGAGNDTYHFEVGFGQDTIKNSDAALNRMDVIEFGAGITGSQIVAIKNNDDLLLKIAGTNDQITVQGYFAAGGSGSINEIRFEDGAVWNSDHVKTLTTLGTAGDDHRIGGDGNDTFAGLEGNDNLEGGAGNDTLQGGAGDDTLVGGIGNDLMTGGMGNDSLAGSAGNDTYYFEVGFGQDRIMNDDATQGRIDTLVFGEGISASDVNVHKSGDDLILSVKGTDDQITVARYFENEGVNSYRIDEISFFAGTS
ncbi:MAG: calcium-binding protein [Desulfobacteraceae bacterium]